MNQDQLLNTIKIRRDLCLEKLAVKAENLERDMKQLQNAIAAGELWRINSLGEIQARGSELDVLCGKISELNQLLKDYDEKLNK